MIKRRKPKSPVQPSQSNDLFWRDGRYYGSLEQDLRDFDEIFKKNVKKVDPS
jgi:hypothetical protein